MSLVSIRNTFTRRLENGKQQKWFLFSLFFFLFCKRKSVTNIGALNWMWIYIEFTIWFTNSYQAQLNWIYETEIAGAEKIYYCILSVAQGVFGLFKSRGVATPWTASVKLAVMWRHGGEKCRLLLQGRQRENKRPGDAGQLGRVGSVSFHPHCPHSPSSPIFFQLEEP